MGATTRRWLTAAVATVAALTLGAGAARAAEKEPTGPVQPNILTAALYSLGAPTIAPPGANDWNCKPSEKHPNPVLLSNGTTANAYENWANLSQKLANAGYCVFAGNFGGAPGSFLQTVGPIADTTKALAAFGDKILRVTGAKKLDVVGHSQGGMNVRYWIKYLGGADKISRLVGLSPSNHGTDLFGLLSTLEMIPGVPPRSGPSAKRATNRPSARTSSPASTPVVRPSTASSTPSSRPATTTSSRRTPARSSHRNRTSRTFCCRTSAGSTSPTTSASPTTPSPRGWCSTRSTPRTPRHRPACRCRP